MLHIFEVFWGLLCVFVGLRWIRVRHVPIVNEDTSTPVAAFQGREAVVAGCIVVICGIASVCAGFGLFDLL